MSDAVPRIPAFDRFAGAVGARWPGMLRRLAALETRSVRAAIDGVAIDRPVYICGLARAGSTLLLELLAQAPGFTAHRYADYPLLWMPYWWNRLRAQLPLPPQAPVERAHRDRIAVTRESPEAFEEVFWMHFFPGRHDPAVDQVLDASCSCQEFTTFYLDHVRKLLAVRGARRYLAKGNYNLARLGLLRAIFPDARFVVAIREPLAHVASLVKQDRLFGAWSAADPAIARQLARGGHYEFGPHKRAENYADPAAAAAIQASFDAGRSAEGYARQWAAAYGWLAERLAADAALARACLLVRYSDLCAAPAAVLGAIYAHIGLEAAEAAPLIGSQASRVAEPDYYAVDFDSDTRAVIGAQTREVWNLFDLPGRGQAGGMEFAG